MGKITEVNKIFYGQVTIGTWSSPLVPLGPDKTLAMIYAPLAFAYLASNSPKSWVYA